MDIAAYLEKHKISQAKFGEMCSTETQKVTQGLVWQWINHKTAVSIPMAARIFRITEGEVTRQEMRPDDWAEIWPELSDKAAA